MQQLNIQEIANAQIKAMHESGEIQKRIEDGIKQSIERAIDSAVNDYSFKNEIERKIETELSHVAKHMNFSAYTAYLTKQLDKTIGKYVKGELADKVKDEFSKVYLQTKESIKLSEIFEAYKEWLEEELSDSEKQDWGHIRIDTEDSSYVTYKLGNPNTKTSYSYKDNSFEFTLFFAGDKERKQATIGCIRLNGDAMDKGIIKRHLSDFEALILNIMFNDTKIIVDVDTDYDLYFEDEYDY